MLIKQWHIRWTSWNIWYSGPTFCLWLWHDLHTK